MIVQKKDSYKTFSYSPDTQRDTLEKTKTAAQISYNNKRKISAMEGYGRNELLQPPEPCSKRQLHESYSTTGADILQYLQPFSTPHNYSSFLPSSTYTYTAASPITKPLSQQPAKQFQCWGTQPLSSTQPTWDSSTSPPPRQFATKPIHTTEQCKEPKKVSAKTQKIRLKVTSRRTIQQRAKRYKIATIKKANTLLEKAAYHTEQKCIKHFGFKANPHNPLQQNLKFQQRPETSKHHSTLTTPQPYVPQPL